jgi:hypothetical protein
MIVYRDVFHLTATFSASLAPQLAAALPDLDPAAPAATPSPPATSLTDPRDRPRPV